MSRDRVVSASIQKVCEYCGVTFPTYASRLRMGWAKYCSKPCGYSGRRQSTPNAKLFVAEVNARTYCAHCGKQPIEWHNPDHVELGRQKFRISQMTAKHASIENIRIEMEQCTALCRRCHMKEDGRLRLFIIHAHESKIQAPKMCIECNQLAKPLRKNLCFRCYNKKKGVTWGMNCCKDEEPGEEEE